MSPQSLGHRVIATLFALAVLIRPTSAQSPASTGGDLAQAASSGGDLAEAASSGGDLAEAASTGGDLAEAASAHLREYAGGPLSWSAWSPAAFDRAEEEGKLVFVSIGYHACPWCRRMDEESFRDEALARRLEENFVCIKVDRLERPDIDLAFRTYARVTNNPSGWPLNVWLTPAGHPVSVGSYFPAEAPAGAGTSTFQKVLDHITTQNRRFPDYVQEQAARDLEKLRESVRRPPLSDLQPQEGDPVEELYIEASSAFDPVHGGFDNAVKFPRPELMEALAAIATGLPEGNFRREQITKMLDRTLDGMLAGAVLDPLDGGLYRYVHDPAWRTPQFEKMLIDQARFARAVAAAYPLTRDEAHAAAARKALAFAESTLRAPDGTYHTSLADDTFGSGGERTHGRSIWTSEQLAGVLEGGELDAFQAAFGVLPGGNCTSAGTLGGFPVGANILLGAEPGARSPEPGSPLATAVGKVLASRPLPPVDDSMITGCNALLVSAYARLGACLGDPALVSRGGEIASQLTRVTLGEDGGSLSHGRGNGKPFGPAFSDDYIFLIRALIDLRRAAGEAGGEALQLAARLQAHLDERFFSDEIGLYHLTPIGEIDALPFELWLNSDGDQPSSNGLAALNLLDLAELRGDAAALARAQTLVRAMSPELQTQPVTCPSAIIATHRLEALGAKP